MQRLQIYVAIAESMISFAALLGAYPVAYGFGFDHRGVLRSINIYILAENIVVVIKIILKVCVCVWKNKYVLGRFRSTVHSHG